MATASRPCELLGLFSGKPTPRLYDAVIEAMRVRHYSRRTEQAYVHWIRRFIRCLLAATTSARCISCWATRTFARP